MLPGRMDSVTASTFFSMNSRLPWSSTIAATSDTATSPSRISQWATRPMGANIRCRRLRRPPWSTVAVAMAHLLSSGSGEPRPLHHREGSASRSADTAASCELRSAEAVGRAESVVGRGHPDDELPQVRAATEQVEEGLHRLLDPVDNRLPIAHLAGLQQAADVPGEQRQSVGVVPHDEALNADALADHHREVVRSGLRLVVR